jgi:hypothetical protein
VKTEILGSMKRLSEDEPIVSGLHYGYEDFRIIIRWVRIGIQSVCRGDQQAVRALRGDVVEVSGNGVPDSWYKLLV